MDASDVIATIFLIAMVLCLLAIALCNFYDIVKRLKHWIKNG